MQLFGYEVLRVNELGGIREKLNQSLMTRDWLTETARLAEVRAVEAAARATSAEAMVRLQAKSIERLMESNDRMVGLVADMRRVGFGILEPLPEVNDTPTTIEQADAAAVAADPELEADDDL